MSGATAVLTPGVPATIAPAGNISFEIEADQRLRLTQPKGEQVADFISFNRDDRRELLSMHSSRAVNLNWRLTAPHVLYSNRTRQMWQIEEDLTRENYCGGGFCSEHLNFARYGATAKGAPNCQSNLEAAIRGYGMDRASFNVDACFNEPRVREDDIAGITQPDAGKEGRNAPDSPAQDVGQNRIEPARAHEQRGHYRVPGKPAGRADGVDVEQKTQHDQKGHYQDHGEGPPPPGDLGFHGSPVRN
jgi:hypothetical protein